MNASTTTNMDSQTNEPIPFPRSFTLEKANTVFGSDLIIVDPNGKHLHYIDHHNTILSSSPDVILRTTPDKSAPILASAVLHSFSKNIEISLPPDQDQDQKQSRATAPIKLKHSGGVFNNSWLFDFTLPTGKVEHFEWKRSSGAGVAKLNGNHRGLKLVIPRTKEVVAVFAGARWSRREKGKFGFSSKKELGSRFELMAVISMLAVTEEMDRRGNNGMGNAGAATAAAGAAH